MTPETIVDYIDNHGNKDSNNDNNDTNNDNNNNINSMPLPPLAAVGYVLMEQKCSLFGLQYKEDPTVVLLYQIAKEALQHQIQDHNSCCARRATTVYRD